MATKIQKWGNSLGVRIPMQMAREIGLEENTPVQLRVVRGVLTIERVIPSRRKRGHRIPLATYVAKITSENRHREVDTGRAVGREEL